VPAAAPRISPSSVQKTQPAGGAGHPGSGRHPKLGSQSGGGCGQPGGAWKRRRASHRSLRRRASQPETAASTTAANVNQRTCAQSRVPSQPGSPALSPGLQGSEGAPPAAIANIAARPKIAVNTHKSSTPNARRPRSRRGGTLGSGASTARTLRRGRNQPALVTPLSLPAPSDENGALPLAQAAAQPGATHRIPHVAG
jgi:hypothetical protein